MKILIVGGGPSGLYFGILMKRADPNHEVVVLERIRADDTFGFGVVFSDKTIAEVEAGIQRARRAHREEAAMETELALMQRHARAIGVSLPEAIDAP